MEKNSLGLLMLKNVLSCPYHLLSYFQKYEIVVKVLSITAVWVIVGLGGHREVGSPLVKRNLSHAAVAFEKTLM